jgi:CRISPR-associated endonuclease/helicase Cas3
MTSLPSFPAFFEALWGYGPFPWQTMLADRIAAGQWPQALVLPTAAGKTACIDTAIYALAFQADKPINERTAPRRIWFVVDRRIVVDEAFERASIIANELIEAKGGPLKEIADRLLMLGGTTRPLAAARLRGGILRDDNWGRLPSQPAVITSTVDQLGSRLLFRGYGRSNLTASIFAGLAAHDSLILLDEAHCSVPFMQTLRAIEDFRGKAWAESPISTPFAFAILSATPPPEIPKEAIFPGADRDHALDHPVLRERMSASKPAALVSVPIKGKRGRSDDPFAIQAADQAWSYVADSGKTRVAVIVNRVDTAKDIFDDLCKRVIGEARNADVAILAENSTLDKTVDVVLLTGRIRPYERDRLVERWKPFLKASSPKQPDKPVILVSTQCIEVGADFSFDALVTEAASLDALRQRFGRLNRMGVPGDAPATILLRDRDDREEQSDPIYGAAISHCWHLLDGKASNSADGENGKRIDFGIDALDRVLADIDDLSPYLAPRPDAPVLLPAYLDLLCQTAPAPAVEPDIGLFLHGKKKSPPEARVVWRADLVVNNRQIWKEAVALCPPVSGEMLSVPLYRLRAWLANRDAESQGIGDVEGAGYDDSPADSTGNNGWSRHFLIWQGRDQSEVINRPQKIKPNDIIVVPAAYGIPAVGQSAPAEALGGAGIDLWEPSWTFSGKPNALRLDRRVFEAWLEIPPVKNLIDLAEEPSRERESLQEAVDAVLAYEPDGEDRPSRPPQWLLDLLKGVRNGRVEDHPAGGVVLFAKASASNIDNELDLFADDDDLASSWIPRERLDHVEVTLADHSAWVKRAVEKIASRCLPQEFLDPLRQAAYWHDVGKLDERFQRVLRQGNEIGSDPGEPLAKSAFVPISPARREAIRDAAGLPRGFRHEFLSFQLVERHVGLSAGEHAADLVLHLVASHHGHARPFAPVIPDPEPPAVSGRHDDIVIALDAADRKRLVEAHSIGSGISDRFWRLSRRYGWWGLAYLEAVLRLADWYGSAHVVEDSLSQVAIPQQPRQEIGAPTVITEDNMLILTGPEGGNPLGFLAALGALLVLHQGTCPQARLGWRRMVTWQPVLMGVSELAGNTCEAITAALRGLSVPDKAEGNRKQAQSAFDAAKKVLKVKRKEIKTRQLRGKERKEAFEAEIAPHELEVHRKRGTWLEALKRAVPSPELALGQRIDCTSNEYREFAMRFLENGGAAKRAPLDHLAAFASDADVDEYGRLTATPFCFITGSGGQYFLDTVRQLMKEVTAERVRSALFEPWTYTDEKLSLRWDPIEDRRYALMDRDPTASDNKSRTVWMANLLAYRALALFSSAPGRRGLETSGWDDLGRSFTWPVWENPIDLDTIRSLMLLSDLGTEVPGRSVLRDRGVAAIFRSPRIKVGSGANFKINFGPARGV